MKIGILSDTHGNLESTAKAVRRFQENGVEMVFHCGDIGSFDVLTELAVLQVPVHAVLGNMDFFTDEWKYFPDNLGVHLHGHFADIEAGGKRFALLHGDNHNRMLKIRAADAYDFVLTGHTHSFHDCVLGRARHINPGAAGKRAPFTCVVLDTDSGRLELIEL